MLKSFEACFDVKSSSVSIKHVGYVESCYNVMTASQCQSRSVNSDMEISHGIIMQCLPENKMSTSQFSYIEIFFLEYNPMEYI